MLLRRGEPDETRNFLTANLVHLGSVRMPEERTVNKVFGNIPDGRRSYGKPKRGGWTLLKMI
jgi:hypothetical protein